MAITLSVLIIATLFVSPAFSLESDFPQPFPNRIIFSQTPEIGEKWRGGIKTHDLLVWDAYWNCADWFTVDLFSAGVKQARIAGENGDIITLTDYRTQVSLKSRPFQTTLWNNPYALAGGMTIQSSAFSFQNQLGEGIVEQPSGELAFFAAQRWFYRSRHYFNLVAMASFMKTDGMEKAVATMYFIPGYRFFIDKKKSWSLDIEHYFMNPIDLPYKTLQYMFDNENNEFYNPDRHFVSFTFWGFSCSRRHLRLAFHLGHHVSFSGPIVPMIGVGWDF
ncbi:MAG: hypothetical protein JXA71_04955 [Chitinispirillaceae bacterium]|nr:hypothetical protein [Chitinispirillaceae bacterium]